MSREERREEGLPPLNGGNRTQGGDSSNDGNEVLGVNVQSDKGASKIQAKLSRKQFEDFKERFAPLQRDLKEFALSGAGQQEAVNEADFAVRQRFERSDEQRGREFSRFGINRTGQQQQAAERSRDLDEVTARVGARNVARRAADRRKSQLLVGGVESSVSPGLGAIKRPREEDS